MGVGRAGDDNGVNCRVGKDRGLRRDHGTVPSRQSLGGIAFDVDNRGEAGSGMARDILRVDGTDPTDAELAEADHRRVFGYCYQETL